MAYFPFATDMKSDWRVEKINGKFYAVGTSLGMHSRVPQKSKHDAERYADKANKNAKEAIEGNAKVASERKAKADQLRSERKEKRSRQLTFL